MTKVMIAVTEWLVYPLILILFAVTLYLIPSWKFDADLLAVPAAPELAMSVWMVIPVLVFAFNHSPAISQFSLAMKREFEARISVRAGPVGISLGAGVALLGWVIVLFLPPRRAAQGDIVGRFSPSQRKNDPQKTESTTLPQAKLLCV